MTITKHTSPTSNSRIYAIRPFIVKTKEDLLLDEFFREETEADTIEELAEEIRVSPSSIEAAIDRGGDYVDGYAIALSESKANEIAIQAEDAARAALEAKLKAEEEKHAFIWVLPKRKKGDFSDKEPMRFSTVEEAAKAIGAIPSEIRKALWGQAHTVRGCYIADTEEGVYHLASLYDWSMAELPDGSFKAHRN